MEGIYGANRGKNEVKTGQFSPQMDLSTPKNRPGALKMRPRPPKNAPKIRPPPKKIFGIFPFVAGNGTARKAGGSNGERARGAVRGRLKAGGGCRYPFSAVATPASCSFSTPMICSSENRLFRMVPSSCPGYPFTRRTLILTGPVFGVQVRRQKETGQPGERLAGNHLHWRGRRDSNPQPPDRQSLSRVGSSCGSGSYSTFSGQKRGLQVVCKSQTSRTQVVTTWRLTQN